MRVILESPYAGSSRWKLIAVFQRWQNRRYARACMRDSLLRGEAPFASHLLYTQPGILCDEIPKERKHGIDAGLTWGDAAQATVVYCDRGISRGMEYGILNAEVAKRHVAYRLLYQKSDRPLVAGDV